MATRTDGVKRSPQDIESEIESRRHELGGVLDELRTRRERVTSWKTHLKHRAPKIARGITLIGGIAAAVRFLRKRRARRHQPA